MTHYPIINLRKNHVFVPVNYDNVWMKLSLKFSLSPISIALFHKCVYFFSLKDRQRSINIIGNTWPLPHILIPPYIIRVIGKVNKWINFSNFNNLAIMTDVNKNIFQHFQWYLQRLTFLWMKIEIMIFVIFSFLYHTNDADDKMVK